MARNKAYEALIKAVQNNDLKGVERVLRGKQVDPNCTGDDGAPLHCAISAAMVNLLCDKGADPNLEAQLLAKPSGYYAPIHTAANAEVVRALAKRGAIITKLCRHNGQSAMHVAHKPEIVDALMECDGVELLNQCDAQGKTPLDYAGYGMARNDISVNHCLKRHGAKSGYQLDLEHEALVAVKKAEAVDEGHSKAGFER